MRFKQTGSEVFAIRLLKDKRVVFDSDFGAANSGTVTLEKCSPWQPGIGGMYNCEVELANGDTYQLPVGFRKLALVDGALQINDETVYLTGFGKHEDLATIGKGHNDAWLIKDMSLLKWIGANSFRTSHYPYAEEVMNLADELGILIIDECPAVGQWEKGKPMFDNGCIGPAALAHHCDVLRELHQRDRHHPCVIAWSVANEPASWEACQSLL